MAKIELEDGEEAVLRTIKRGRIIGLTKWEGREAKVVILTEESKK